MIWLRDKTKPIAATQLNLFSFEIVGPDGKPVDDLEPYMGMGGHAEFIKEDGSVFAHVHPTGSVPMASVAVASPAAMMAMHETKPGPVVSFPYGVPTPGKYRIFVQMKRAGKVETGGVRILHDHGREIMQALMPPMPMESLPPAFAGKVARHGRTRSNRARRRWRD